MQTLVKTLTGAQIILHTLRDFGVDSVFGYPGSAVLPIYDELSKQLDIKHYSMCHEQAVCHAAEGYAKVSGKCGVIIVTSGPGATNLVTGLSNAYVDGTPLVVITGQVESNKLNTGAFQEVDIVNITKSCTKKNFQVTDVESLQGYLNEAFYLANEGRKGPVLISVTKDILSKHSEYKILDNLSNVPLYDVNIENAINMLETSKCPVIICGGGASFEDVQKIAHLRKIPVVTTMKGFYPQDDFNYCGIIGLMEGANVIVKNSDVVFAIGTRLNDKVISHFEADELLGKMIRLDIKKQHNRAKLDLIGDSKIVLKKISESLCNNKDSLWLNKAIQISNKNVKPQKYSNLLHTYEVINAIKSYTGKNTTITTEVGQHQILAVKFLKDYVKNFVTSGGIGTMGFGFPAAIGASIAQKYAPVVCIAGDGSFLMNMQEISTCVKYNLPVKVFVINNSYLGMIRQIQECNYEKRYYESKIKNPDFVKLADSFGATGLRVEKYDDLTSIIEKAFKTQGPVIVDCVVEKEENV